MIISYVNIFKLDLKKKNLELELGINHKNKFNLNKSQKFNSSYDYT